MADRYMRQVAPRDATATLPFARPETFGAGLADAVGEAAFQIGREGVVRRAEEVQLERDKQASAAALQLARIQEEAIEFALEQQSKSDPGGAGYTRQIEAFLQDREAQFLGSIGDERVREIMATRFANWRSDTITKATAWEKGQSVALAVANYGEVTKIRANQATRGDNETFTRLVAEQRQDTAMLEGVAPDIKVKLLRGAIEEIAVGFLTGRAPQEQMALLDSGLFDSLDPNVVRQLRSGAEIEIKRKAREDEAAARAAQAEVADAVDAVLADVGDGLPVTDAVLADAQSRAEAAGLDNKVKDLFDARIRNQANREFQNVGVVGIDNEVKALNAKIAKDGDNARRADIIRRDHLEKLRTKRRSMIENDPADFASRLGIEWQPLAINDMAALPASIAARKQAARATAAAAGLPVKLLTDAEARQFNANMATREGRAAVLNIVAAFGSDAGKVIDQVAPDQPLLKHLTGLTPKQRDYALEGAGLIASKGVKLPSDINGAIRARIGTALNGFDENARAGVIETTRAIYAYWQGQNGDDGETLNERIVASALDRALGNIDTNGPDRGGRGGLAIWRGNARFVLPPQMSRTEFDRRVGGISKLDGFFWSDGKTPITPKQLRDHFVPVALGGGKYMWRGPSGSFAVNGRGKPAELDIAALRDPGTQRRDIKLEIERGSKY
ncbi:MAG: hypothetical protein ACK4IS_13365 [Erythrobacter sp.]